MADRKTNPNWEQHKNQDPKQNEGRGSKEEVNEQQNPYNRLKDGTNDLVENEDANLGEASEKSSTDNPTQKAQ